jgi:phosphatidylinositol-3-phosphatase
MRRSPLLGLSFAALSYTTGCHGPATFGNTDVVCRPLTVTQAHRAPGWSGSVFVIVMENHSMSDIMGSDQTPTIHAFARGGALAAGYHDSYVHPSEPNYLWMVAGENFGILDDNDPGPGQTIASTSHLADQLERAGLTWRAYEEGMGDACGLASQGEYAAKHDPFVYFDDLNGWNGTSFVPTERCKEHVVDFSQLAADLAAGQVPDYAFITPNLLDDMHDGTVAQGDAWLASLLPELEASPAYTRGGAIFLLWDEGSNESDDPPFIVGSPNAVPGIVSQVPYDTSSFLLTVQKIFGLDALPCSAQPASVHSMDDLFSTEP